MLVADPTYEMFEGLSFTGGAGWLAWTITLFRAGIYWGGNTYMQMRLQQITAQIAPVSLKKINTRQEY